MDQKQKALPALGSPSYSQAVEPSTSSGLSTVTSRKTETARDILQDVQEIKKAQVHIADQLENIKHDNTNLYTDVTWVKGKVGQQQIIIDKLLHFLMMMLGGRRTFLKRTMPLMVDDSDIIAKRAKELKYIQMDDKSPISLPALEAGTSASAAPTNLDPISIALPGPSKKNIDSELKVESSHRATKSKLTDVTEELQQDINALRDILINQNVLDLPRNTVESLFDDEQQVMPKIPVGMTTIIRETGADEAGRVPISIVAAEGLEKKNWTQQNLVDTAAETAAADTKQKGKARTSKQGK